MYGARLGALLLLAGSLVGCMTAKDQKEEKQELQRSIQKTTDPDSVRGCAYIMKLKPESRYGPPEQQVESLVISKPGVWWVILDTSAVHELYSCKESIDEPSAKAAGATAASKTESAPTPPAVPAVSPTAPAESRAPVPPAMSPAPSEPSTPTSAPAASAPRVTSNPEAVHGCRFLESYTTYRSVSQFQADVVRTGGNVGLVVATNRDGDVIGESYSCSPETRP
jgi:hypothetical protein